MPGQVAGPGQVVEEDGHGLSNGCDNLVNMRLAVGVMFGAVLLFSSIATAEPCTPAPIATWGVTPASSPAPPVLDSPVARARDLLARAKILDEQATSDERSSAELALRLPQLKASAKAAREKAEKSSADERDAAVAHAEELEADVVVSEAEIIAKKRTAADNRQTASMLRSRALQVVREGTTESPQTSGACDPPFRFTADGRKIYRVECFR